MSKKKGPNAWLGQIGISMEDLEKLAKSIDSPQMRKLYDRQKMINPNLEQDLNEVCGKVQEIFKHKE